MLKIVALLVSFSLFALYATADIAEQVTIRSVSKNQVFVVAPNNLPFLNEEILNVETDCPLIVQSQSPGALILKTELCKNTSRLVSNGKIYLVRKEFGNQSYNSGSSNTAAPAIRKSATKNQFFHIGLIKSFFNAKSESRYFRENVDAEQTIGFSLGYQAIPSKDFGFDIALAYNQFENSNTLIRASGAGVFTATEMVYVYGGPSLNSVKIKDTTMNVGLGLLAGVGFNYNHLNGTFGYVYSKNTKEATSTYFDDALNVELSGLEMVVGASF